MTEVFVVCCFKLPMSVWFSMMDAEQAADELVGPNSPRPEITIVAVPLQPVWMWLWSAMGRAKIAAEARGEKPVVIPDSLDAFLFAMSEMGEAADAIVQKLKDWKRNHPQAHGDNDFEEEASQTIMMLALSLQTDFFPYIKAQLAKWGFVDDPYQYPVQ